jgi:hypothetical protein
MCSNCKCRQKNKNGQTFSTIFIHFDEKFYALTHLWLAFLRKSVGNSNDETNKNNENLSEKIILQNFIMYGSKEVIVYSLYVYLVVKHMALTSLTSLTSPIVKIEELLFFHDFP